MVGAVNPLQHAFHASARFVKSFSDLCGQRRSRPLPALWRPAYMPAMKLRAVCFDYGGTLDGPGSHWLPRFLQLYRDAGLVLPFDRFRAAFDHATRCGYADRSVSTMDLQALIEFHVARQLEHLDIDEPALAARIIERFVAGSRAALAESRAVLDRLRHRVALGVISNFYGNVDRILNDAGIGPWLSVVIDSTRVGVSKPDKAIFTMAIRGLGCAPGEVLYVGDSFEKDVAAARAAGLRSAWLVGAAEQPCPDPGLVDVRLHGLAELEAVVE
jgi:HAD superfamily hydrolase (TIGR01549 family)